MTPADIDADDALFGDGDGLGLDSIDALELIVLMENSWRRVMASSWQILLRGKISLRVFVQ